MNFISKKASLFILVITAIVSAKVFFLSLNDPEGANLLISVVLAGFIYFVSLIAYKFNYLDTDFKKFLLALFIQVIVPAGLIFFLS